MFYLENFFKTALQTPVKSFCLFFLTVTLIGMTAFRPKLETQLRLAVQDAVVSPYFHALIDGRENYKRVSRKLLDLPGVKKVQVLSKEKVLNQAKALLNSINLEVPIAVSDLNFAGLKVILDNELKNRSQNLIRDYITRLVGKKNITLGAIKRPSLQNVMASKVSPVRKYGFSVVIGIIFILWLALYISFSSDLNKNSYLLEQFQRKKGVALKSAVLGLGGIFGFALAICFAYSVPSIWVFTTIIMGITIVIIHGRTYRWES